MEPKATPSNMGSNSRPLRPSETPNLYPASPVDEPVSCLYPTYSEWDQMSEGQKVNIGKLVGEWLQRDMMQLEEDKAKELENQRKAREEKKSGKRGRPRKSDVDLESEGVFQRQTRSQTAAQKKKKSESVKATASPAEVVTTTKRRKTVRQPQASSKKEGEGRSDQRKEKKVEKIPEQGTCPLRRSTGWVQADEWEVENIVDVRVIQDDHGNDVTQYRIKWVGWEDAYNNWENSENVSVCAKIKFWRKIQKEVVSKNRRVTVSADSVALEEENVEGFTPRYLDISVFYL